MPFITIEMFHGRPLEQKRALVKDVTEAVVKSLGVSPDVTFVIIHEVSKESIARGGILAADR